MSQRISSSRRATAATFAALGDETRLLLLAKLCESERPSIAHLTEGTKLTRQAVTKHLRVLQRARVVRATRAGRESLFDLDLRPIQELRNYLERVSDRWDEALTQLKEFVEADPGAKQHKD